jgi:hypothetical protein
MRQGAVNIEFLSQAVSGRSRAVLGPVAPDDFDAVALVSARGTGQGVDQAIVDAGVVTAACTDASGNYVGDDPDPALDEYIGVESLSGHLLCPGCRRYASPTVAHADPERVAGLVFFGTSDENLYVPMSGGESAPGVVSLEPAA